MRRCLSICERHWKGRRQRLKKRKKKRREAISYNEEKLLVVLLNTISVEQLEGQQTGENQEELEKEGNIIFPF